MKKYLRYNNTFNDTPDERLFGLHNRYKKYDSTRKETKLQKQSLITKFILYLLQQEHPQIGLSGHHSTRHDLCIMVFNGFMCDNCHLTS